MTERGLGVAGVIPGSAAQEAGICAGDRLVRVNGEPVEDIIDFLFFSDEPTLLLELADRTGEPYTVEVEDLDGEDLGILPESERVRMCANRCPFCFVDQMPKGFRSSLYLKDDDWRTSFLHGSYVTLTNVDAHDLERIVRRRVSPLYVSVHATDDAVRRRLLGNSEAAPIMPLLRELSGEGIRMFAQAVVVGGENDGSVLRQTIHDLFSLYPSVGSLSVVPVGLTSSRKNLCDIVPLSRLQAREILEIVEQCQAMCLKKAGTRFVFAADELYLKGEKVFPASEAYEDYTQIENGVGLVTSFLEEARLEIQRFRGASSLRTPCTWVTGTGFHAQARKLAEEIRRSLGVDIQCAAIENRTFGPTVNVTGLLTGADVAAGLGHRSRGTRLILPAVMFRDRHGVTLDDMTPEMIAHACEAREAVVTAGGEEFIRALLEREDTVACPSH